MGNKLFVLLENIRSAYNVGSIFRTCDAAGVDKLFLTGYTAYPPHPKLNKTALGSFNSVKWEYVRNGKQVAMVLKKKRTKLISLEANKDTSSIFEKTFIKNTCLVFGNELSGISQDMLELSDEIVHIPQFGKKESLNVAVAAGIAVYEFKRKQSNTKLRLR
jgi:23S rRNA (guanosine2251-2'-O)-methyltransferase